jgi:hypothetical protein
LPAYVPCFASALIQLPEFGNDALSALRSAKAPATMYFIISVLPISTTSGTLPPASVASSFWRCVPQVWYSTFTSTPGCCAWNVLFAASTAFCQPDCASTISQTVRVFAWVRVVAAVPWDAVPATIASSPATSAAATIRSLIEASLPRRRRRQPLRAGGGAATDWFIPLRGESCTNPATGHEGFHVIRALERITSATGGVSSVTSS